METTEVDYSSFERGSSNLMQQITTIRNFIYDLDMDLQGYEWNGDSKKYTFTGDCLVASDTRSKLLSTLKPFASDINLMTELTHKDFSKMKYRTLSLINRTLTVDFLGMPIQYKELVLNKMMNTLFAIGGVILGSKKDLMDIAKGRRMDDDKDYLNVGTD